MVSIGGEVARQYTVQVDLVPWRVLIDLVIPQVGLVWNAMDRNHMNGRERCDE